MEHNLIKQIMRLTQNRDISDDVTVGLIENALEQYRKANLNEPAKYIKIFDSSTGYLKFDTKLASFTVGDKSSYSGWYQVKFKRSEIDPKLYDIFGTNK